MATPSIETLDLQRQQAREATRSGPPRRTSNPFFGVGPITDASRDEVEGRLLRFEFEAWLESNYRKLDDRGRDLGPFTVAEVSRSMHRGYPADKFLLDMMREIHRYFGFPKSNRMAVGLGGGHSGFTVCALHLVNANDRTQQVFVDTPRPESVEAGSGGFFRQSWGAQLIEMLRYAKNGNESSVHFGKEEGAIPSADALENMGINVFFGVGHETTGATTYTERDIENLLEWLDRNQAEHHAVLDATSMLGAMPWRSDLVRDVMAKCCMFMPFQKAIGGVSGYFVASFTPHALRLVESNQREPSWAIPRQFKLAVPSDARKPLTGQRSVELGPFYDPVKDKMLGGVINTFSTLAFAETTFGLLRSERRIGNVAEMNRRSVENREKVNEWVAANPLFELGVSKPDSRGAAVTLLRVRDPDVADPDTHARIVAKSKQLLGYEGITHANGDHEPGLDVARYVNAFPGTPGDYRAWIGGIRQPDDVIALLENLKYAYLRAKIAVLEELLATAGKTYPAVGAGTSRRRTDDPGRAYKVLIADLIGLKLGADGRPDASSVRQHIESKGGVFHDGPLDPKAKLARGKIHFFYQPHLSTESEILAQTSDGQYDALIAAATFIPRAAVFRLGGVRIGAGTGNMGSASWGGGNGEGGEAPLMNTPSFNSRATAQMVMKALVSVAPDLPVAELHRRVVAREFDTGRNLREFPTEKLEGKKIAIIGYGNIGREVAKLAKAFGMRVAIHARPRHKEWIECEGFTYAESPETAARHADFISPHTGLGALNTVTGKYANAGVIDGRVFAAMNDGAVLINYDRGEVVDAAALDAALASGKLRFACIDADIFVDAKTGKCSGPMLPYLDIEERHRGKLQLLPHAAADTEHHSRVEGARQAVDQIFDVIQYRSVTNLKGDLPEGYVNAGSRTVKGIGKVTPAHLLRTCNEAADVARARAAAEAMAAIWGALATAADDNRKGELIERYGATLVRTINEYRTLMEDLGLEGPYG
jgi:lactate dehydrogenase-like 2-hydroxyacid dehydrogenase/phosphoserine aminotransferase